MTSSEEGGRVVFATSSSLLLLSSSPTTDLQQQQQDLSPSHKMVLLTQQLQHRLDRFLNSSSTTTTTTTTTTRNVDIVSVHVGAMSPSLSSSSSLLLLLSSSSSSLSSLFLSYFSFLYKTVLRFIPLLWRGSEEASFVVVHVLLSRSIRGGEFVDSMKHSHDLAIGQQQQQLHRWSWSRYWWSLKFVDSDSTISAGEKLWLQLQQSLLQQQQSLSLEKEVSGKWQWLWGDSDNNNNNNNDKTDQLSLPSPTTEDVVPDSSHCDEKDKDDNSNNNNNNKKRSWLEKLTDLIKKIANNLRRNRN